MKSCRTQFIKMHSVWDHWWGLPPVCPPACLSGLWVVQVPQQTAPRDLYSHLQGWTSASPNQSLSHLKSTSGTQSTKNTLPAACWLVQWEFVNWKKPVGLNTKYPLVVKPHFCCWLEQVQTFSCSSHQFGINELLQTWPLCLYSCLLLVPTSLSWTTLEFCVSLFFLKCEAAGQGTTVTYSYACISKLISAWWVPGRNPSVPLIFWVLQLVWIYKSVWFPTSVVFNLNFFYAFFRHFGKISVLTEFKNWR